MNLRKIECKIKDRLWEFVKDYFYSYRVKDSPLLLNINYDAVSNQKKTLICYIPNFFFQTLDLRSIGRTIPLEMFKIIKVISEFGYCIDIVSVNDLKSLDIIKSNSYSLIFGFGETFYKMTQLQPSAVSVFYVTENHPEFSYREEKKRLDYFYERHRIKASFERSGRYYKLEHVAVKYDHIIVMGEEEYFLKQYEKPNSIFPTGLLNPGFIVKPKDHNSARKHFLWLGSPSVIHKGLDLLIDTFRYRDDITLHICGLSPKARKLLDIPIKRNIIDYGFINIKSEEFLRIVNTCSFSILLSCSEGMATSITTSMLHGLIPVVMRDAGFNKLGEHAIYLDEFSIEYVNKMLSNLSASDPAALDVLMQKVLLFASQNFTLEAYEKKLKSIFLDILK